MRRRDGKCVGEGICQYWGKAGLFSGGARAGAGAGKCVIAQGQQNATCTMQCLPDLRSRYSDCSVERQLLGVDHRKDKWRGRRGMEQQGPTAQPDRDETGATISSVQRQNRTAL